MLPFVVTTRTDTTQRASDCMASTSSKSQSTSPSSGYQTLDQFLLDTGQSSPEKDSERWVSYSIEDLYPEWQLRAHCRGVGVGYYFGEDDNQPTMSIKAVRAASK